MSSSAWWTIAYRKPTANRFLRADDFAGTWAQASELAGRFAEANPSLQVYFVPTKAHEIEHPTEDSGNILTETGRRVRIVEGRTVGELQPVSEYEARQEFEWNCTVFVGERETECPAKYRAQHNLPPFVADPLNPTDAELAAAIDRGLADGSIIDAEDFLASAARHGHATTCTEHGGRDLAACDPADCDEAALAASFTVSTTYPAQATQTGQMLRCKGCGYTWQLPAHATATGDELCSVCFQEGRFCFAAPVPADQVAQAVPGIAWLDHDALCQDYRSQGVMPCTCSPVCRCLACDTKRDAEARREHEAAGPEHAAWCAGPSAHLVAVEIAHVLQAADSKAEASNA
jgi:hypothetical protein